MAALREVVAQFDVRVDGAQKLDQLDKKLEHAKKEAAEGAVNFRELGMKIAEAFAVKEVFEFVKGQAEVGAQLEKTSKMLGISTEELQHLQYAADLSDVSAETLTHSLGKLQIQLGGGIAGKGGPAIAALQKLGVHTKDAAGKTRDMQDILQDAAEGIKKIDDPTKRAAAAVQLFGKSGREMLPMLSKGREGIADLIKEADELGIVMGRDFVENSAKALEQSKKLDWSWRALKGTVAQELYPGFKKFVDIVTKVVKGFMDIVKHTTAIKSLFVIVTAALVLMNLEFFATAAAVAIVFIAFDDLFALFTGNKSVVGDTIDELGKVGDSAAMVKSVKDAWNELTDAIFGTSDASGKATGETMSFLGVVKATISQTVLIISSALASVMAEVSQMIEGVKAGIAFISGDKAGEKKAQERAYAASETASKAHKALGAALTLDNIKSANDMSTDDWRKLNGISASVDVNGNKRNTQRKALSSEAVGFNKKGQRISETQAAGAKHATVHIVNNIHAPGGDPAKVQAAVNQGTTQALSQSDLRNAHQAVRSTAPAVQ
jgi:plasmid maintenance system antidote protein VapI